MGSRGNVRNKTNYFLLAIAATFVAADNLCKQFGSSWIQITTDKLIQITTDRTDLDPNSFSDSVPEFFFKKVNFVISQQKTTKA